MKITCGGGPAAGGRAYRRRLPKKEGVGCVLPVASGSNQPGIVMGDREKGAYNGTVLAKIRLDFKGKGRPGRLFGGRSLEQGAEEAREHHATLFRNVPLQGVQIDDIDVSGAVYTVLDEGNNSETAYAPVVVQVSADSLEEMLPFIVRAEFRKIEILEPATLELDRHHLERLLFRLAEESVSYKRYLERKFNQ